MPRRRSILTSSIAVGLVVAIIFALNLLGWLRPIVSAVTFVTEPVVRGVRVVAEKTGSALSLLGRISDLERNNQELAAALETAETDIARLREDETELHDLRTRLDAPLPPNVETLSAGVIGHDSITGTKRLTINRGASDGIIEGAAVLSATGIIIGHVDALLGGQAEVLLLADDRSKLPCRIAESRATGIARGQLGLGITMTDIPQSETVNVGDQVVTSGLDDSVPSGIPIGLIEAIEASPNALFQEAQIRPYVEVTSLEFVHIVTRF